VVTASSQIQQTIVFADVGVHVPQPGQQRFVGGVHNFRSGGRWRLAGWSDRADAVAG
jgi:hypothetical protein